MAQTNTLILHIITLQYAEMNWRAYLNDIQERCQILVFTPNPRKRDVGYSDHYYCRVRRHYSQELGDLKQTASQYVSMTANGSNVSATSFKNRSKFSKMLSMSPKDVKNSSVF